MSAPPPTPTPTSPTPPPPPPTTGGQKLRPRVAPPLPTLPGGTTAPPLRPALPAVPPKVVVRARPGVPPPIPIPTSTPTPTTPPAPPSPSSPSTLSSHTSHPPAAATTTTTTTTAAPPSRPAIPPRPSVSSSSPLVGSTTIGPTTPTSTSPAFFTSSSSTSTSQISTPSPTSATSTLSSLSTPASGGTPVTPTSSPPSIFETVPESKTFAYEQRSALNLLTSPSSMEMIYEKDASYPWAKLDRKVFVREEKETEEIFSKPRGKAMLPNTTRIFTEKPENRFANDFMPPKPKSDMLAAASLESFSIPTKNIVRVRSEFKLIPTRKAKHQEYDIDVLHEKILNAGKRRERKTDGAPLMGLFAALNDGKSGDGTSGTPTSATRAASGSAGGDKPAEARPASTSDAKDDDDEDDGKADADEVVDAASLVDLKLITALDNGSSLAGVLDEQKQANHDSDGILTRFQPDFKYVETKEEALCGRKPSVPLWQREFGSQFLIHCKNLNWSAGKIEPFFCTLTLYDLKKRIRLSENFHFDLNDASLLAGTGHLEEFHSQADQITLARHAVFSITERHDQVYLVLKVERVLQGDPSEAEKEYLKVKQRTPAEFQALVKKARQNAIYLSEYRQPFAWGMWKLFDDELELREDGKIAKIDKLFWQVESLTDKQFIATALEVVQDGGRRQKLIPSSTFDFSIREIENDMPSNRVDPSSIALKDTPSVLPLDLSDAPPTTPRTSVSGPPSETKTDGQGGPPIVKEILEFMDYTGGVQPIPNTYFINLLYLYPDTISLQKARNVCCKIQVRNSDGKVVADGLKVILGKSSSNTWVNSMGTQVNYHKRSFNLQDEVKVLLPPDMTSAYHLFFTFYKVSCKKKPGKREAVGHAVLPLFNRNRMVQDGYYYLLIVPKISKGYMTEYHEGKVPTLFVAENQVDTEEGRKSVSKFSSQQFISVKLKLVSSIFNQDNSLNDFFQIFPNSKELHLAGATKARVLLQQAVGQIPKASAVQLVRFLCPTMEFLWKIVASKEREDTRYFGFLGIAYLVQKVSEYWGEANGRCQLLASYINHQFENIPGAKPLYLTITELWLQIILHQMERESEKETHEERLLVQYSWFFFETTFKSISLEIHEKGSLPDEDMKTLVITLGKTFRIFVYLMHRHRSTGLSLLRHLTYNLSLFLLDLSAVLEKAAFLYLMTAFVHEFHSPDYLSYVNDPVLVEFKFTFYAILFDSEYIIAMNEPEPITKIGTDLIGTITAKYRMVALMLDDFALCLNIKEEVVREKVVDVLRHIVNKFDYDQKIQAQKADVALMFFPLVPFVMRHAQKIRDYGSKSKRLTLITFLWILKHVERKHLRHWLKTIDPPEDMSDFLLLLELCVQSFQYCGIKHRENDTEFRSILSPESIGSFIEPGSQPSGTSDLKSGIEQMMAGFHRDARNKHAGQAAGATNSDSATKQLKRAMTSSALGGSGGDTGRSTLRRLRQTLHKSSGTYRRGATQSTLTQTHREYLLQLVRWEGALSQNVSRVVLSVLLDFIEDHQKILQESPVSALLKSTLTLYTALIGHHQINKFLVCLFPPIKLFILKYGVLLFRAESLHEQLMDFVMQILRHCTFNSKEIRAHAVSTIYLLLTQSFAADKQLMKLQEILTVSLSKLIPDLESFGENNLQSSLTALPIFAQQALPLEKYSAGDTKKFEDELQVLLARLSTILGDSMEISRQIKLGEEGDPTTIEHLLLQVANANSHMPEVRIQWLDKLAEHHAKKKNYAESGQAYLAIADLYITQQSLIPFGAKRRYISVDAAIEAQYESGAYMLEKGELYEQCSEVYKLLIPLYEKRKNYKKLSWAYRELHLLYDKLLEAEQNQSRMLGTYYRVGFYGAKFGPRLDGNEFVYKMPKITRLAEIAHTLKTLYTAQLKEEVTILPDSGPIEKSKLNPKENLLQITFVAPEFCTDQQYGINLKRDCFIEQNFKIRSFKYCTPFTAPGKKREDIKYRQQRNTVLNVEFAFPFVKTAQRVVSRDESIFSPMESATDDVAKRVEKMNEVLEQEPVNSKRLSALIGGSLLPLVNGGVNQICESFLVDQEGVDPDDGLTVEERNRQRGILRKTMRQFIDACKKALDVNKAISEGDEKALLFHQEVASKFDTLCTYLQPLINDNPLLKKKNPKMFKSVSFSQNPDQSIPPSQTEY